MKKKFVVAAVAMALLGACGSDRSGPNPIVSAAGAVIKGGGAKASARKAGGKSVSPAERRAKLEEAGKPILRVASKTLG